MSRRHGFTLLEIMLAILIGLLLTSIAVPSITGMLREQKLKQTFEDFDDFVRRAQAKAVKDRRTYLMVWDETGIALDPLDETPEDQSAEVERFEFSEDTEWSLERPASLVKKPVWEWPFWRSGTCEPVIVHYRSPAGSWSVEFNGLTARGKVIDMEVK
ncbi:MAG: hypothetical protein QOE70_5135 [Chthoniobacter sp.]|jgi:prepilin-type N-terminal cleavage/methylation domain-containing protein|nr:hypothetical protein [Chthoniobacter sp.]